MVFAVLVVVLLLAPTRATAQEPLDLVEVTRETDTAGWRGIVWAVIGSATMEMFVPDVRYELGDDGDTAAMGWPLTLTLARLGNWDDATMAFPRVTGEPQLELDRGVARGVFTARIDAVVPTSDETGPGLYAEGGYVVGADSNAPLVGGGALWMMGASAFNIVGMYRATLVEPVRHDITVNVEFAWPLFLLYQDLEEPTRSRI